MSKYNFHETSFRPPCEANYAQAAVDFIAEFAPSLPGEIRDRLAQRATAVLFQGTRGSYDAVIEDPVLNLHKHWVWPEADKAFPYSRAETCGGTFSLNLWEPYQWFARNDAKREQAYLDEITLDDWAWNAPMTQVRAWRDKLLPERPKRGRKFDLLLELWRHPDFLVEAQVGFEAWRQEQQENIQQLLAKAAEEPRATHLRWLARLVFTYLQNYHTATNSTEGPEAFAAICLQLQAAAQAGVPHFDEEALNRELEKSFDFVSLRDSGSKPVKLAKSYLDKMRTCLTAEAIAEEMRRYAPGKMVETYICQACAEQIKRRPTKRKLAPYHVLCACGDYRWLPKGHSGSVHNWDFGDKVDLDATIWALDRLLGINQASLPVIALVTRVSVRETFEQVERDVDRAVAWRKKRADAKRRRSPVT